jgi:ribosomal protein S18 acetylase RimI-like enzyme
MICTNSATPDDFDDLVMLFDGYRQFYGQPSQPGDCRAFLAERLRNADSAIFIARDTGNQHPLGFTQLYPSFSSVRMRPIWWLNDLFVTAQARGRGAGRALLDAARVHAIATGAAGLMLETGEGNARAQGLYQRYGYQRVDPGSRFYWYPIG